MLIRRLEETGTNRDDGITFREAYDALSAKFEAEADRRRKLRAETDLAEMAVAQKTGELIFAKDAQILWGDVMIETRKTIQRLLPEKKATEVLVALSKIRVKETL